MREKNDEIPYLQTMLHGSKIVLVDLYKIFMDANVLPGSFGLTNVKNLCCINSKHDGTGGCERNTVSCIDRNDHMFYDAFHPTEVVHFLWARRCNHLSHVHLNWLDYRP